MLIWVTFIHFRNIWFQYFVTFYSKFQTKLSESVKRSYKVGIDFSFWIPQAIIICIRCIPLDDTYWIGCLFLGFTSTKARPVPKKIRNEMPDQELSCWLTDCFHRISWDIVPTGLVQSTATKIHNKWYLKDGAGAGKGELPR